MFLSLIACTPSQPPPQPKNVIVVMIDTLRFDQIDEKSAPFITQLRKEGLSYENAWSTSSWTAPSTASFFTGLHPIEHGIYRGFIASFESQQTQTIQLNIFDPSIPTIAEKYKAAGYHTYGVASNVNIGSDIGFDRGFDHFFLDEEAYARELSQKILSWEPKEPYFMYIHYNDVHSPYLSREPWYQPKTDKIQDIQSSYRSEISYVDSYIEQLYRMFSWNTDTLLLISDHGEEFMDHGQMGHLETLYRELTQILFVLHDPQVKPEIRSEPTSLTDAHHLLLQNSHLSSPASPSPAISQRVGKEKERWSITTAEWRLVDKELYRSTDLSEKNNLALQYPETVQLLQQEIDTFIAQKGRKQAVYKELTLGQNNIEMLKELGYIE
ncbi:MAG: sulfatase [Myxococcota bacterium]|nr:sulfatase [Myxococcota bacterium]